MKQEERQQQEQWMILIPKANEAAKVDSNECSTAGREVHTKANETGRGSTTRAKVDSNPKLN